MIVKVRLYIANPSGPAWICWSNKGIRNYKLDLKFVKKIKLQKNYFFV